METYDKAGPSDHLRPPDQVEQGQATLAEQHEVHDQADPSRQTSNNLELNINDFEICSMELHKPHDQTQVISSQSFPEIRQTFADYHPDKAQHVEQQQDTLAQQHEADDQAGPSRRGDAQLDTEDRKILEHDTKHIFSDEKWDNFINSLEISQKEFFSGLVSNFPMETIQQAEQAQKYQQDAGPSDHLRSQDQVEQGQAGPNYLEKLPLPQNQALDHLKGEIDYSRLTYFLTPEEHENLLSGLNKIHRTPKEYLAVKIFNTAIIRKQQLDEHVYIKKCLDEIRKENRYKEIYGNEGEKWRSDQEPSKRTWTTQQLHQLVDETVQIKDFEPSTFQNFLSEESKAICEQLNKYGRSLNDQEWKDIKTRFQMYKVMDKDKRRKYLRLRTENSRKLQRIREIRANSKAQEKGFTNRHERGKAIAQQQRFKNRYAEPHSDYIPGNFHQWIL